MTWLTCQALTGLTGVDVSVIPLDAVSISDLARKRGVSKQAIHKRVKALEAEGRLETWQGPNRSMLVSEAAFDFAVGQTGDPAKEAAAASAAIIRGAEERLAGPAAHSAPSAASPKIGPDDDTPAYRDAKARDAHYAAEIKRLNFELQNKQLYPVAEVEAAMVRLAGVVKEAAKGLVSRAEEGAEAIDKGMPAFRRWLVLVGDDLCRTIAAEWRILAEENEATVPSIGGEVEALDDED